MRVALAILLVACTHHRDIKHVHELVGDEVVVEGRAGQRFLMVGVVAPEGAAFQDKVTGTVLRTNEIVKIEDVQHGRGALDGMAIGGSIGVVLGAIAGYTADGDDCNNDEDDECWLRLGAEGRALIGAVVLGGIGTVVGLVVGGIKGSTIIYDGESMSLRADPGGLTMTF